MEELTPRQAGIHMSIQYDIVHAGFPSAHRNREITRLSRGKRGGRSPQSIRTKRCYRDSTGTFPGIRLTHKIGIPVVGRVAVGQMMLSDPNIESHFQLESTVV